MKKHIIITACDEKNGDFLIKHWLRSLQKNVNLEDIDVMVIDYALNDVIKKSLLSNGVIIFPGHKKGHHIVTARFLDAKVFLENKDYDQVLFCDCGDLIFQKDISHLFEENKNTFRAVAQEMETYDILIQNSLSHETEKIISKYLEHKPVLNAGFFFSPKNTFIELCEKINSLILHKQNFGPDQIIVNYILYKNNVVLLHKKYNFLINSMKESFTIRKGYFYLSDNELIAVVHNAGHISAFRPILIFGYGKGYNYTNYVMYYFKKIYYAIFNFFKKPFIQ